MFESLQDSWQSRMFYGLHTSCWFSFQCQLQNLTSDLCDDTATWEHSLNSEAKFVKSCHSSLMWAWRCCFLMFQNSQVFHNMKTLLLSTMYGDVTLVSLSRCLHIMGSQMCFKVVFLLCSIKLDSTKFIFCNFPLGALDEHVSLCNRWEEGGDLRFPRQSFPGIVFTHQRLTTNSRRSQASQDGKDLVFFLLGAKFNPHSETTRSNIQSTLSSEKWGYTFSSANHFSKLTQKHNHTFTGFSLALLS